MKKGDLVLPKRSDEFIFLHARNFKAGEPYFDDEPMPWSARNFGIVLDSFGSKRSGKSWVRVLTATGIGFCYDWELAVVS